MFWGCHAGKKCNYLASIATDGGKIGAATEGA